MGRLSTLLRWHQDDPVDDRERARNDAVEAIQGIETFIDNPAYVERIWSHLEDKPGNVWPVWDPLLVQPWINEIHYENAGVDAGEGFEIAGPAGTNLTVGSQRFITAVTVAFTRGRSRRHLRRRADAGLRSGLV